MAEVELLNEFRLPSRRMVIWEHGTPKLSVGNAYEWTAQAVLKGPKLRYLKRSALILVLLPALLH